MDKSNLFIYSFPCFVYFFPSIFLCFVAWTIHAWWSVVTAKTHGAGAGHSREKCHSCQHCRRIPNANDICSGSLYFFPFFFYLFELPLQKVGIFERNMCTTWTIRFFLIFHLFAIRGFLDFPLFILLTIWNRLCIVTKICDVSLLWSDKMTNKMFFASIASNWLK